MPPETKHTVTNSHPTHKSMHQNVQAQRDPPHPGPPHWDTQVYLPSSRNTHKFVHFPKPTHSNLWGARGKRWVAHTLPTQSQTLSPEPQ